VPQQNTMSRDGGENDHLPENRFVFSPIGAGCDGRPSIPLEMNQRLVVGRGVTPGISNVLISRHHLELRISETDVNAVSVKSVGTNAVVRVNGRALAPGDSQMLKENDIIHLCLEEDGYQLKRQRAPRRRVTRARSHSATSASRNSPDQLHPPQSSATRQRRMKRPRGPSGQRTLLTAVPGGPGPSPSARSQAGPFSPSSTVSPSPPPKRPRAASASIEDGVVESKGGNEWQDVSETFTCSICQELIVGCHSLSCGHTFCYACVARWLKKKKECPTCRTSAHKLHPVRSVDQLVEIMVKSEKVDQEARDEYATRLKDYRQRPAERKLVIASSSSEERDDDNGNDSSGSSDSGSESGSGSTSTGSNISFPSMVTTLTSSEESSNEDGSESSETGAQLRRRLRRRRHNSTSTSEDEDDNSSSNSSDSTSDGGSSSCSSSEGDNDQSSEDACSEKSSQTESSSSSEQSPSPSNSSSCSSSLRSQDSEEESFEDEGHRTRFRRNSSRRRRRMSMSSDEESEFSSTPS